MVYYVQALKIIIDLWLWKRRTFVLFMYCLAQRDKPDGKQWAGTMIRDRCEVYRSHREVVPWRREIFPRRLENVYKPAR